MIPSNPNPRMSREEVKAFHAEMERKMRGEFTPRERELYRNAKKTYDSYLKSNGGKNPIFNF